MAQTWQLQQLTASGWRTIAQGPREHINSKFQETLLQRGERRIMSDRGVVSASIKIGGTYFDYGVRS